MCVIIYKAKHILQICVQRQKLCSVSFEGHICSCAQVPYHEDT
jgi:hypothetical protein